MRNNACHISTALAKTTTVWGDEHQTGMSRPDVMTMGYLFRICLTGLKVSVFSFLMYDDITARSANFRA